MALALVLVTMCGGGAWADVGEVKDTAPVITTETLAGGTEGAIYSETIEATGKLPITWNIAGGSLPGGLTLDPDTGKISGKPTAIGVFSFTVEATNAGGSNTKSLSLHVFADGGSITLSANPFADISGGEWFYEHVTFIYTQDLMTGVNRSPMLFSPSQPLTRGMLVTVLYRMAQRPDVTGMANPFADVPEDKWYTDAVKWAASWDIVTGYNSGGFGADNNVTRQDVAVILKRYSEHMGIDLAVTREYTGFNDQASVSAYAKGAVESLFSGGIIDGKPGQLLDPNGQASRAEAATMLHRFVQASPVLEQMK